ncbi:MAG: ubiquinol-cytochrome c reductase iron-sulfur subunit [Acidobacteria bacterium]|nr:ubiquinol-cytochrome c reductase iron-sulfur subunit [Acidobacteriota bacterium]MBI3424838.1 ubiquinol-cytochrome c reductase iron-sulfur subunit [Acidobacteriota bacterium]
MKSKQSWLNARISNLRAKTETEQQRLERLKQEVLGEGEAASRPTRRSFLTRLGFGATLLALAGQAYAFLRSLKPNVLYEAPQRFKVGTPDQFGEGGKFLEDKRLFVFRQGKTFYAISASCTHLGCTVKMEKLNQPKKVKTRQREFEEQYEFHCPCHGSKYYGDGTNYAGPAPRPLDYFKLELAAEDGQLIVDMEQKVGQDFRLTV